MNQNNNMINDDDIKKLSKKMVNNINLFENIIAPQLFNDKLSYSFSERLAYYYFYPKYFIKKLISFDNIETKVILFCIIYIFYSYFVILSNIV